jgi:preprotein translocase subunit SecF
MENVIRFVDTLGNEAAKAIGPAQGAKLIAISAMAYGFVCGFIVIYIWTRTALREDLEKFERERPGA